MMSAAKTIKKIRIKLCLSQHEFAEKIGITTSTVCNYETKRRLPRLSVIRKLREFALANGIKVEVEDFLEN